MRVVVKSQGIKLTKKVAAKWFNNRKMATKLSLSVLTKVSFLTSDLLKIVKHSVIIKFENNKKNSVIFYLTEETEIDSNKK